MDWLTVVASSGPPGGGTLALNPWLSLVLGVLLVFLNGFFVAAEFALVKVRPTQIAPRAEAGDRRAKIARHMITHLDAYLSSTQLGITLASLALGWIGEPAFAWVLEPLILKIPNATPAMVHSISLTVAFLMITILHIVLGELAPKSIAIRKPEASTLWTAVPLYAFYKLTFPAIFVLNWVANRLLKWIGIAPVQEAGHGHSADELRLLLSSTSKETLSKEKKELLDNIFELSNRTARQVMVPRADMVYLSTTRTIDENLALARESGHTRFPLCEGEIDKVIGLIHIKDLFRVDAVPESLLDVRRDIAFVPETMSLDRLLRRMRAEQVHLAAVLDEYGGVSGIVTLENVIEEIVGQIQDEFDREEPLLTALGSGSYRVSGSMLILDLEEALGLELSDRDEDTIGGVILSELGRRARPGDEVPLADLLFKVEEVDRNRILTLGIRQAPAEEPREASAS